MKILFVCLGNICRSPLAEGILKKKMKDNNIDAIVDSAGLEPYHIGQKPDERTLKVAEEHGLEISDHVMRLFSKSDFDSYDQIFVMDQANLRDVLFMARNEDDKKKVRKVLSVLKDKQNKNVPDPYYGKYEDFEEAHDLLEEACELIVRDLKEKK